MKAALLNKTELLAVIDDIRRGVESGDSLEGFINWLLPYDEDAPPNTFSVEARYRIGDNPYERRRLLVTMGQGGYQVIGDLKDD